MIYIKKIKKCLFLIRVFKSIAASNRQPNEKYIILFSHSLFFKICRLAAKLGLERLIEQPNIIAHRDKINAYKTVQSWTNPDSERTIKIVVEKIVNLENNLTELLLEIEKM